MEFSSAEFFFFLLRFRSGFGFRLSSSSEGAKGSSTFSPVVASHRLLSCAAAISGWKSSTPGSFRFRCFLPKPSFSFSGSCVWSAPASLLSPAAAASSPEPGEACVSSGFTPESSPSGPVVFAVSMASRADISFRTSFAFSKALLRSSLPRSELISPASAAHASCRSSISSEVMSMRSSITCTSSRRSELSRGSSTLSIGSARPSFSAISLTPSPPA